jgi:hypothetical protein
MIEAGRVIRPIKRVVELLQLLDWHILDVAPPPDRRVMIRMREICEREDLLLQRLRRIVLADLKLVPHHRHLRLTIRVAQPEIPHPVRLDFHVAIEVLAPDVRVVIRAIEPRRRVIDSADLLEQLIDARALFAIELRRALEHQMLEQVRRARCPRDFIPRADAIRHHEGERRARVIRFHEHLEAVAVEPVLGDIADCFHEGESRDFHRLSGCWCGRSALRRRSDQCKADEMTKFHERRAIDRQNGRSVQRAGSQPTRINV